jgi:prepilin-type N-terminal cleavage/methylation domain-containing protein
MNNELRTKNGFSLMEVLLAIGILSIGMIFIAGVFPAAIYLMTVSTEQSIGAAAADEAFAKIRIYDVNWADPNFAAGRMVRVEGNIFEFAYPSTIQNPDDKQYYWSALCRKTGLTDVQVTVFVCRKIGSYLNRPVPVLVGVSKIGNNMLQITNAGQATLINDGYTVVDNVTGQIYRVLERSSTIPINIVLDRPWQGGPTGAVWVVPPPAGGGRYPCVAVYQKVIRF